MPYTPSDEYYPYVARPSEPIVVRIDKDSLLVGNTCFYAKVKTGISYKGFLIFVSGVGFPVYEKTFSNINKVEQDGVIKSVNWTEYDIKDEAKKWLDDLEIELVNSSSSTDITKSLDTLCWQLHYDLTKTTGTPPSYYDSTISTSIDKSNTVKDYSDSTNTNIGNVYTSIGTFDSNLNSSTTGSMFELYNRISPSGYTVHAAIEKVATNLKSDNDLYTISKALRDSSTGDYSVAHSVEEQTTLISNSFTDIQNSIGESTDVSTDPTLNGKLNKLDNLIGTSSDTTTSTLFGYSSVINSNVGSGGSSISSVATTVNNIYNKLGSNSTTSGTVWYDILHNAGTKQKGVTVEADSPIAWTRDKVLEKIGTPSTANTLWYDVLHNPGTQENTAGYSADSCVGQIIAAI